MTALLATSDAQHVIRDNPYYRQLRLSTEI